MKPTVGRIVHYFDKANLGEPQAAIVTKVTSQSIAVHVFLSDGPHVGQLIVRDLSIEPNVCVEGLTDYWTWPPKQ